MTSCIYRIINKINDRFYIGSATDFAKRKGNHLHDLRKGKHKNKRLQRDITTHGISTIVFEIIECCNLKKLLKREQYYINTMKPYYNICPVAGSSAGRKKESYEQEI